MARTAGGIEPSKTSNRPVPQPINRAVQSIRSVNAPMVNAADDGAEHSVEAGEHAGPGQQRRHEPAGHPHGAVVLVQSLVIGHFAGCFQFVFEAFLAKDVHLHGVGARG